VAQPARVSRLTVLQSTTLHSPTLLPCMVLVEFLSQYTSFAIVRGSPRCCSFAVQADGQRGNFYTPLTAPPRSLMVNHGAEMHMQTYVFVQTLLPTVVMVEVASVGPGLVAPVVVGISSSLAFELTEWTGHDESCE